eukprot:TRINITY_DN604_c3_g1_i1.p1 TRINITY_DN604_c3_g1~~TRINITY_DN604_c3_g1_i1.p1  ORF type:complete len:251 (-),score=35.65 TRINITY_DN604_c3_g1_i1:375-1127(-)
MALLLILLLSPSPLKPSQNPNPNPKSQSPLKFKTSYLCNSSKRDFVLKTATISIVPLTLTMRLSPNALSENAPPKPFLSGISNTKSWFCFYGEGFSIRVPPQFEDVMEPQDYNAGLSLYGDKAKPKTFAARFASSDGSEVLSVVIRPSNQLKITFLEAKDITDLGSLKVVSRIFVPGGATLYSARAIKIKESEGLRTYYYYEFGIDDQHVALVTAVNSGKVIIAGAAAPKFKWEDDGIKLRSAAISLSVL